MSDEKDIALRKKIAEALLKARKIVADHRAEYTNVYTASGGGGTTTSNSSTTVPPDVLAEYNQVTGQANQVASQPLNQYGGQTVAGLTPDETSAFSNIDNMQGITAPYTQQANNLLSQASQTINPQTVGASQIQNYESPYTQGVLNSTMAAENNQDAQQQAQLQGNAISSGAWGGDRAGVAQGILGGQQALANNATNAGIENQGYSQALSEANTQQQTGIAAQEASQSLQESAGLGENQVGTSALANGLTGANAQLASGQLQQQQAQSELNVPYENFLQQQAYPFQTTGWLGNIAEGIGSNEGGSSTSSTTQPSEGLFSDRRLKKNIHGAGILAGRHGTYPLHTFEYKGSDKKQTGVIAQEVEKTNPAAVHMDKTGYRKVDYSKLARGGIAGGKHLASGGTSTSYPAGSAASIANTGFVAPAGFNAPFGFDSPATVPSTAPATAPASSIPLFTMQNAPSYSQFLSNEGTANNSPTAAGATYSGGIVPGLNSDMQSDLSSIYGGKFKRGGIVPHRDSGGDVSSNQNQNLNASTPILQHISQIPQRLRLQQLQQQAAYGTGNTQAILNGGMARGGIVPQHYDAGGGDDGGNDVNAANIYDPENEGPGVLPSSANDNLEMASNATPEPMPAPTLPPNAHDMPSTAANYQMPSDHAANPWLSVAAGVLGTLAGRSRNPLVDIGQGGLIGLNNYAGQQKEAFGQNYQEGSIQQNAQKMMDERNDTQARLKIEQQNADQTAASQKAQAANQRAELGIRQQELQKPVFDKAGNPWQYDQPSNTYKKMSGTLGSDENSYGYKIGTVPEGTSAPVLDSKYDPTIDMPATQKAIYNTKVQLQLEKDNAAAATNNDTIARLQASKQLTDGANTGGITNMFGIGPVATAFDTQRQEIEGLNKELALAPGERPQGLKLTQGEIMLLKQAQPGTDKSPEANANMADAAIAIRQRPAEFAQFKNDFVANNGYWNDAVGQQMYNQYVNDNPIFSPTAISDPSSKDRQIFALNKNRMTMEQYSNSGKFAKYGVAGDPARAVTTKAPASGPASKKVVNYSDLHR